MNRDKFWSNRPRKHNREKITVSTYGILVYVYMYLTSLFIWQFKYRFFNKRNYVKYNNNRTGTARYTSRVPSGGGTTYCLALKLLAPPSAVVRVRIPWEVVVRCWRKVAGTLPCVCLHVYEFVYVRFVCAYVCFVCTYLCVCFVCLCRMFWQGI